MKCLTLAMRPLNGTFLSVTTITIRVHIKKLTFFIIPLVQGCWRKVTIDDSLPFLEQSTTATGGDVDTASVAGGASGTETTIAAQVHYVPLYPRTAHPAELWPAIITKAVLKIAALE